MANLSGRKKKGREFWRVAVERVRQGESAQAVAKELGVDRSGLQRWERRLSRQANQEWERQQQERALTQENEKLKRALAEKVLEVDFLRGALHKVEARRQRRGSTGAQASTTESGK